MAIDFPNSPTVGQIFTSGDKSWIWDGTVWKAYGASLSPTVLKVDSTNSRVGINNQSPATALDVTGTALVRAASTQDGVALAGRAGGTSSYEVTLTPTTLTADRTLTLPDATGTVALTTDPGLQLVKTQTVGSAVSSVTVSDAFSSTYDNYWITLTGGTCSTITVLNLALGSTTTGYYFAGRNLSYSSVATDVAASNTSRWEIGVGTTDNLYISATLFMPNLTKRTMMTSGYVFGNPSGGGDTCVFGGYLNNATSYTAFTISTTSGTMTGGTIRVYGYRN